MSVALVVIHKTQGGHKWSNTHGVIIGAQPSQWPTEADVLGIGADTAFTDANTSTAVAARFLHALVAFERSLHYADVQFTDIYVQDGKRQDAGEPNVYFTASLTGNGRMTLGGNPATTPQTTFLMVGSMAWLIHRNVLGLGHKPGRLYIRGGLKEQDIISNGPRMAAFTDATTAATYATYVTATAQPFIAPYLSGGASNAQATYALPVYLTEKTVTSGQKVGELDRAIPILSLSSVGPVNRQVQRGRKRKKAAGTVAV